MMKLPISAAVLCLWAPLVHSEVLYVSPKGPLATLEAARDKIRVLRRGGVRGGSRGGDHGAVGEGGIGAGLNERLNTDRHR